MAQLNIIFENVNKFYFEGEKIRIKLEVNLEKPCNVNNIMANFVGMSTFFSNDGKENNMSSKLFTRSPGEIYFDDALPLFVAQNKESAAWSPGVQVLTFDYQLPHSLPTSIESAHGFVRYSLHLIADLDGEILKKSEYFTVVSKTDLNKDSSAHLPGVLWKPENLCFLQALFCKSNSVRAFVHIAKRGYVPGECLFINAEVSNFHRVPIEWVKASLIQVIKYSAPKSFVEERLVAEVTRGCVLPSETQTWRSESMLIPAIPPTTYSPKRLIRVKYKLLFQFKGSWENKASQLKQKVAIGAVRLVECGQGEQQGHGEGEGDYSSQYFNGSNLEPCIFGPHTIEEDGQTNLFSPLYPMYAVM